MSIILEKIPEASRLNVIKQRVIACKLLAIGLDDFLACFESRQR